MLENNVELARFASHRLRGTALLVSIGAALHFVPSCLIWGRFLMDFMRDPNPPYRRFLLEGGPAALFLLWFLVSAGMAWRRWRASAIVLLVGLILAVTLFAHDAATRNWQMHAESYGPGSSEKTFFYFTWWWYDQRWLDGVGL